MKRYWSNIGTESVGQGAGGAAWVGEAPTGLTATVVSDTRIDLAWTNVDTTGTGVSIERSIDGVNYSEIATVALGVTSYSNTGLTAATLYYYRLRAYKGTQYGTYSSVAQQYTFDTRNADIVEIGGYLAISTGDVLGIAPTGRWFLNKNNLTKVRQSGSLTQIQVRNKTPLDSTNVYFQVWRKSGTTYNLVGEEDIFSRLVANTTVTITLNNPISVIEGDYIGMGGSGGTNGTSITCTNVSTANSVKWINGANPGSTNVAFDSGSADTYPLTIKLFGQAPLVVCIGDSITAGHPGHYSYIENSLTDSIANSINYQLSQQKSYVVGQNMGIGSQTSTLVKNRITTDVVNLKPKYCILNVGVNDIFTSVSKTTYINNITDILTTLTAASIKTLVITILPWTEGTNTQMQTRDDWNGDVKDLVDTFYSASNSAKWVDLSSYVGQFRAGGDANNLWDIKTAYNAGDNVHFNQAGYTEIATRIIQNIPFF